MLLSQLTSNFLTRISAKVIYGTIILGAVLGSLSDPLPERNLRVIVIVLLSLYLVSVANAYARIIDADMAARKATPWREKWKKLLRPGWVMASTVIPVAFFALAATGLVSQFVAFRSTIYGLLSVLLFFGFISRRLCGGGAFQSLLSGFSLTMLGYVVVQAKLWTKYMPVFGF
jgi:hypothetical protein